MRKCHFHGVLCDARLHFGRERTFPYTLHKKFVPNSVHWKACLAYCTQRTFPYTLRTKMVVLHCVLWDACKGQSAKRIFSCTIYTKMVVLHRVLWGACVGQCALRNFPYTLCTKMVVLHFVLTVLTHACERRSAQWTFSFFGRSPLYTRRCLFRWKRLTNLFLHTIYDWAAC
jgi:hypothetical protein